MALLPIWSRVEPHAFTSDIDAGLAAEVADPLWMVLRQWQLGELHGDDSGSPAAVDISVSHTPFTRYRLGSAGEAKPLDGEAGPIEAVVEREPEIRLGGWTPWSVAVRAGRRLSRILTEDGLPGVAARFADDERTRFNASRVDKEPPPEEPAHAKAQAPVQGVDDHRYRALLTGRGKVIDGVAVLEMVGAGPVAPEIVGDADPDAVEAAIQRWSEEMHAEWGVTTETPQSAAWDPERMEYGFSLAAPPFSVGDSEIVLRAAEYDGTGVRWDSVDLDAASEPHGAAGDAGAETRVRSLLPSALRYAGMPADRFWEFEDAAVALGRVRSGPTDLVKMIAVDFAIVYSPDWHLVPVEVPVGSVARVDWMVVRDTFGVATLVGSTATQAADGAGRLFQPANLGAEGDNPVLVVLPSALGVQTSDPLEDVALQRDEMANLAWSIEKLVLGPSGRPVTREWFPTDFDLPAATSEEPHELVWRLATRVANPWTPLVAVLDEPGILRRARILDTETTELRTAQSLLLSGEHDVRDEEVTRAGLQLRMVQQRARTSDGATTVWRSREKRPWKGEASSGLRFDATTPTVG